MCLEVVQIVPGGGVDPSLLPGN